MPVQGQTQTVLHLLCHINTDFCLHSFIPRLKHLLLSATAKGYTVSAWPWTHSLATSSPPRAGPGPSLQLSLVFTLREGDPTQPSSPPSSSARCSPPVQRRPASQTSAACCWRLTTRWWGLHRSGSAPSWRSAGSGTTTSHPSPGCWGCGTYGCPMHSFILLNLLPI